jgi:hypothetical protein
VRQIKAAAGLGTFETYAQKSGIAGIKVKVRIYLFPSWRQTQARHSIGVIK